MLFFTSDTHFGHANIIKYCNRPFKDVQEMDRVIRQHWNEVVRPQDVIFHLGDFSIRSGGYPYIGTLNGQIHILPGDHGEIHNPGYAVGYFVDPPIYIVKPEGLLDEYGNQREISLCHYAMRSWHKSHYASWHLFGHHHNNLEPYGLSFDVGVDGHDFYPWSLDEIQEKMAKLSPIVDFRNKG